MATVENPEFSLVMPCYNEEACLRTTARALLHAFQNHKIQFELVLVNNGSRDSTGAIIDELIAEGLPVTKVHVPVNQGYGHGILEGLRACNAPIIGYACADGQVSAEDTVRVYKLIQGTDGRMLVKVRRRFRKDGWLRKANSIAYNSLMLLLFGRLEAIDLNGSPKIFSRESFRKMQLRSKDWFLDPEIMIKAKHLDLMVLEMNVRGVQRQGGKSNVRLRTCVEFVKNILRYRFGGTIRRWKKSLRQGGPVVADAAPASQAAQPAVSPAIRSTAAAAASANGALAAVRVLEQPRFSDARGYLQKILMASQCEGNPPRGEVYVTAALPGEAKGNHLHRKMGEWFAIVQGEGAVEVCDPQSGERRSIALGVSRPRSVYVPAGVAHAVVNTGKETLVCVAWAEADYDAQDIFPYPVWPPVAAPVR